MKESKFKGKKKIVIAAVAAALAASVIIGSTFLWFTAQQEVENVFDMDGFEVVITENFDPNTPVVPDTEITKEVGVENKSRVDVAVRVQLKETLQLLKLDDKQNPEIGYKTSADLAAGEIMVTMSANQITSATNSGYVVFTPSGAPANVVVLRRENTTPAGTQYEYIAYVDDGSNRVVKYTPGASGDTYEYGYYVQGDLLTGTHGMTGAAHFDHDAIKLVMNNSADWTLDAASGYYYYNRLLEGGQVSPYIVSAVQFDKNMDNLYKGAVYTLSPVMQAVQGVQEAADAEWGAVITINADKSISVK